MKLGIVDPSNVLSLSREGLTGSGVVVATVRPARPNPDPGSDRDQPGDDRDPACDVSTDPLCDGGGYDNYTLEVVDRMGFDSFTPDSGVLLAKTKNRAPGVGVAAPQRGWARCTLPLRNTGTAGTAPYGDSDVYRLSATTVGRGWTAWLPNALATAKAGERTAVRVYAKRGAGAAHAGQVRLTATSESDPTKKATTTCTVVG
ncbi:hypothetical protein AB0L00_00080 [Actinoallomurus sp. NPDC052308]|uniref:hypothetical protein n=1 Tax=Actinoallomurus sp. NPDC052308 TaxID=3155530 RepID=UPI003448F17A